MNSILDDTLKALRDKVDIDGLRIVDLLLRQYHASCPFNSILLSDGSIGSCMNYHEFDSRESLSNTHKMLTTATERDPLLLDYLSNLDKTDHFKLGIMACVVNALSYKTIVDGIDIDVRKPDWSFLSIVRSATVIGFGGWLKILVDSPHVEQIHISDLLYEDPGNRQRSRWLEEMIDEFRSNHPRKRITISNGQDNSKRLSECDLAVITGSSLCNGTLDDLLKHSRNCNIVALQGQSACIYPRILFERGISLVSTTIKPNNLIDIARTNFPHYRSLLEGGLPTVHIYPKEIE